MDISIPLSASSRRRASVGWPAPDGQDRTSMMPRRSMVGECTASLDVLNLLTHPLDLRLELQAQAGDAAVVGFRAERVGFAIDLLRQEIEPSPDRLSRIEQFASRGNVSTQPLQLLLDVGPGGK